MIIHKIFLGKPKHIAVSEYIISIPGERLGDLKSYLLSLLPDISASLVY